MATIIPQLLQQAAQARPQAAGCCQRDPGGSWAPTSWLELWQDVRRRARAFRRLGLARGDRLAILAPTCRAWQVAEMAGLLAGGVILGIEPHAPAELVAFVLDHAGASGLVVDGPRSLANVPAAVRARLKFVVQLEAGGTAADGAVSWQEMILPEEGDGDPEGLPAEGDPAVLLYTAGTTGTPKGILYSHAQILAGCRAIQAAFPQLREGDSTLCWLPMAHMFQRMLNLVAINQAVTTYFVEDPRQIMACIREASPSLFVAVPRFYEKLHEGIRQRLAEQPRWRRWLIDRALAAGAARGRALRAGRKVPPGLRLRHAILDRLVLRKLRAVMGGKNKLLITGSAPTATWLLEFLHSIGLLVLEGYALSENTLPIAANRPDAFRFGSVGKPLPENQVRFAEDGEILVKGPGLFTGYYREERGPQLFTADGYYRTGDYGRLDEDGFLYLLGRKSEIIKTSTGRRISPARIEAVYRQSPYLDQAVVFGDGRKHLVALVTLNPATLADFLRQANLTGLSGEELAQAPAVRDLIRREMDRLGRGLAPHEQVRDFAILPRPLDVARGELTPTLKLRRAQIAAGHAALLESLYQGPPPDRPAAPGPVHDRAEAGR
jgi:long-chain acyl-CoA synthetase